MDKNKTDTIVIGIRVKKEELELLKKIANKDGRKVPKYIYHHFIKKVLDKGE